MMQTLLALLLLIPYVQCGGIRFRADPGATSSSAAVNVGVAPMLAIPPPFPMFPQESNDEQFKRADDDKNGKLNFNEFLYKERYHIEAKKNEFKQFDTDSDGFITTSEHRRYYQKLEEESKKMRYQYLSGVVRDFDSDHDRKLSPQELMRLLKERYSLKPKENFAKVFAKFDTHKDNVLDMDEFEFFERNVPYDQFDRVFMGPSAAMPMPMPMPISAPMAMPISAPMPAPMPKMQQNRA